MLKEPENLDNLLKQRNAHEELAAAQLQSLNLRQLQLQALEDRLKRMEEQQTTSQKTALSQKQKQLEQFERQLAILESSFPEENVDHSSQMESITTESFANNLMSNFPADLEVQRQTLEKLSYLEDQLAQLKELKFEMMKGAEMMEKRHKEVKDLHELESKVIEMPFDSTDQVEIVDLPKSSSNPTNPDNNLNRSELEVATDAMLSYLNMKEEKESGQEVDENAVLEQLMQRLMAASVDKNDFSAEPNNQNIRNQEDQEESEQESNQDNQEYQRLLDDDDSDFQDPITGEDTMTEILATSEKIDSAIAGLSHQINQVKQSESLITTEKERAYYEDVLGKLQKQMDELVEIRSKINYYKELLDQNQEIRQLEEEMSNLQTFEADFRNLEVNPEENNCEQVEGTAVAAEALNVSPNIIRESESNTKEEDPVVEIQTAFEVHQEDTVETLVKVEKQSAEEGASPQRGIFSPRPNSSMSISTSTMRKPHTARVKKYVMTYFRLFEQNKDAIYQKASNFISKYEARPHFLLSLFQKLGDLVEDDLAQQEILLFLDELINVKNEEYLDHTEGDMSEAEMLQRLKTEVVVIKGE